MGMPVFGNCVTRGRVEYTSPLCLLTGRIQAKDSPCALPSAALPGRRVSSRSPARRSSCSTGRPSRPAGFPHSPGRTSPATTASPATRDYSRPIAVPAEGRNGVAGISPCLSSREREERTCESITLARKIVTHQPAAPARGRHQPAAPARGRHQPAAPARGRHQWSREVARCKCSGGFERAGLNTDALSHLLPLARFHLPLIEPDVQISRIRLSFQIHAYAHRGIRRTVRTSSTSPYFS